jgi:hypothetical protein
MVFVPTYMEPQVFSNKRALVQQDFLVATIFEPKKYMGVFSTHFVPLISILAPKIMEE